LLRLGLIEQPTIAPPAHIWRLVREEVEDARPATEGLSDLPRSPDTPVDRVLGLALVPQLTAPTARKLMASEVQLGDAPSAELAASSLFRALEPETAAAEIARRQRERATDFVGASFCNSGRVGAQLKRKAGQVLAGAIAFCRSPQ
jgi:alkylhydroperoxidase family enzyme